jgi:hypothetical protein
MSMSNTKLWYSELLVGHITDILLHQGTWFGIFRRSKRLDRTALVRRLDEYIAFCRNWNERQQDDDPPGAEGFEDFNDVMKSGSWVIETAEGEKRALRDAPNFFGDHEISWAVPMNETEWVKSEHPGEMLNLICSDSGALRTRSGRRKLRLFGCACCRRIWGRDGRSRRAIEKAERIADGVAKRPGRGARPPAGHPALRTLFATAKEAACGAYVLVERSLMAGRLVGEIDWDEQHAEYCEQANSLRDIFGPLPFRSILVDPAWLAWNNGAVRKMAMAIYEQRKLPSGHLDHGRLGVLADALEAAGCANGDMLSHLRRPEAVHVRGCWVIDLLLNKA